MKKTGLIAVVTALCMLLSGCAALLDQDYVDVTPYKAVLTTEGDSSTLRAENYQELVNALMYFVTTGAETGRIRLYMASGSDALEAVLDAACLEVVQEDPLGAYAVDYIKYSISPVVTYSEADVQIFYRRSREQVESITSVTGTAAIRSAFESLLTSFGTEQVLRISYFDGDEAFIRNLFQQTYYAAPLSAVDQPAVDISIYPESGRQRIVELNLRYHLETPQLISRRNTLISQLRLFSRTIPMSEDTGAPQLAAELLSAFRYNPEGGSTTYHALTEGGANSEGLALAFTALCQELDVPCLVVQGRLLDADHFWNLVRMGTEWYHMDLSAAVDGTVQPYTDGEMTGSGYLWSSSTYPTTSTQSLLPAPAEPPAEAAEPLPEAE